MRWTRNHEIFMFELHFYGMQGTGIKSFRSQYRKQKDEIILSNDVQNFFIRQQDAEVQNTPR